MIDFLLTTRCKVLIHLYAHQEASGFTYITQKELACVLGLDRTTVNKAIKELRAADYITVDQSHNGRYQLCDKAYEAISQLRKLINKEM